MSHLLCQGIHYVMCYVRKGLGFIMACLGGFSGRGQNWG